MGREASDWDLATSALPGEVQRTFRRTIPTGLQHGTVTVMHRGEGYEVTTLRGEGAYSDGRRPDSVEFVREIEEDLARRDFTVNAIAYDPLTRDIVDPWGGLADLEAKLIRAVGDPRERFGEDGLRVLRAARFAATLAFELHPDTMAAIPSSLETFAKVSPERVHDEWRKALRKSERPSRAFEIMHASGILGVTCPPLAALDTALWSATMGRLDALRADAELRMAGLLLDLEPRWSDEWLRGLRASNSERKRIVHLVRHGRWSDAAVSSDLALRAWLRAITRDELESVLTLARADGRDVEVVEARALAELATGLPLAIRELPVNGKDIMKTLDVRPSRAIGDVLERLLLQVHADPSLAEREALLARIPEAYVLATAETG